ncbi:histidine kinase [Pontibacter sp. E15-1]|uniref:sensor histidine kinase n=1 Tax=Pontibacter sp. E15-1 TaxID=2919918 RepID=UPI001F4F221B|nr:histidine kinase [Pontibacter sp. E15-1]MCJ8163944.1 histidine kinase [Pontibacter sp. E15-1]
MLSLFYKSATMKDLIIKPTFLNKVEFWAATTIYVFAVFFLSANAVNTNRGLFDEALIRFNYYENHFLPQLVRYTVLYLVFLLLNYTVVPRLIRKEALFRSILLIVASFLAIGLVFGIVDTYHKAYLFQEYSSQQATYNAIFQDSFHYALWLLLMFGFYTIMKYIGLYLLTNSEAIQSRYRIITRDALGAFMLWMISMFLLLLINADGAVVVSWGIFVPFAIAFYCYSFYSLIPKALGKKHAFRSYMFNSFLLMLVSVLPVMLLGMLLIHNAEGGLSISFMNMAFQLLITVPLSWVLFKRQMQGNEELFMLRHELGQSNANLDFLRSQINPHFLFNTLNTLYGTALQENSERTAQGIQMLGDMMRFMLHENHQQKILLSRESEYMRNYIALQSLRTSTTPDIVIQAKLEDVLDEKFIAPMLLIPFVENAFKHGISLKQPSWIRVTLHYEQDKLYFDVYNSTHAKKEQDPEKGKSGVGLENVRQRLALLYPDRHELVIRETLEEFFVHLTLQL